MCSKHANLSSVIYLIAMFVHVALISTSRRLSRALCIHWVVVRREAVIVAVLATEIVAARSTKAATDLRWEISTHLDDLLDSSVKV